VDHEPEQRGETSAREFLAQPLRRRAFLAGVVATVAAAAASMVGLLTWRARHVPDSGAGSSVAAGGIFGEWVDAGGLPGFRYTLDHRTDPRAEYVIRDACRDVPDRSRRCARQQATSAL